MLYTIIQIIAFQALFLLVYDLFLKRETFFNYNRAYLLITSVLSLVLPFIKFSELKAMTTEDFVIQLPEVFIGTKVPTTNEIFIAEQAGIIIEQPQTPLWQSIAILGIVLAASLFLFKICKLYWLKHKNPKRWQGNVLIVNLIKSSAAFSFFNTIFLGERIPETEKPVIFKHELVHIKEFHTLDLLFFEILKIIFWFNPLIYIYQNRIKELHEYIADAKAVKQNGKVDYYQSLLNQVFDVNNVSFTNTFFKKSLIKKRIAMLQKSKSKQLHLLKYALLVPLVFGMLIYSSTEVRAQEIIDIEQELNKDLTDKELIDKYFVEIMELDKDELDNYSKIENNYNYTSKKYIPTKNEFLRYVAYMRYMGEKFEAIAKKSNRKIKKIEKFAATFNITKSYDEYLDYLKTDEAEKNREVFDYNRTLQVISNDIDNLTEEEHKDAYEKVKDVLGGYMYRKLIIRDETESVAITKNNYDAIIRFFSAQEIKSLLNYIDVIEVVEVEQMDKIIEVPFSVVDQVPTLEKCKDLPTNQERKTCMNNFVNKHVNKNFNTSIADSLKPGKKRIFVQFKIDTEGNVKDIKARGPSEALEEEAKRVIKTLPQFIPGRQKGKLVTVPFSIPIVFKVSDVNAKQVKVSYEELVAQRDRILKNSSEENPVVIQLNKQINDLKKDEVNELAKHLKEEINRVQKDSTKLEKIPFSVVDVAPVHIDCKTFTQDEERRKCTTKKVNIHVNKNFNTDLAKELGIIGRQEIYVAFTINKDGYVSDVKARASREELEAEAIRVIKKLPQFLPGKHDGETVDVPFSLPIYFQVNDSKKD